MRAALSLHDARFSACRRYIRRSGRSRGRCDRPHQPTDDALAVVLAAQRAAHEALARTPEQLDVLASAGVVDAGGQAYVLLIDVLVEVLGGAPAQPLTTSVPRPTGRQVEEPRVTGEYEVMYTLRGARPSDLDALRERLSGLGHSVVIVGDEAIAQVHVTSAEAGGGRGCAPAVS